MATDVMIMAGGTGGHVYPALAVAQGLRDDGKQVTWLGSRHSFEAKIVPKYGYDIVLVDIKGLRGKGIEGWLIAPFRILKAIFQAARVIRKHRPKLILGFGGFVAGPGGVAAKLLGVPLIIHEQNAIAGMTNKWLSYLAKRILVGFPTAFHGNNVIHVGNPVRAAIAAIEPPEKRINQEKGLKVLVLGGSLGALALNQKIPVAISKMQQKPLAIRHQCGKSKLEVTQRAYQKANIEADIEEFIKDMKTAYAWADIIICRAGALTIAELAAAGVGSILIPYPHAVDDHQTKNAEYLSKKSAAFLIQQKDLNSQDLADILDDLSTYREKCMSMAIAARTLAKPKATDQVVRVCEQEMK